MAEHTIALDFLKGSVHFSPETKGIGSFKCGDAFKVEMKGAKIGVATEAGALLHRCRKHETLAFKHLWTINTQSKIPMGSEPQIVREWTLAGHLLTVTSDIRIGGKVTLDRLENDSMKIVGQWVHISLLTLDESGEPVWTVYERKTGENQLIYNQKRPPMAIIVESVKGDKLEICTGEDLWRYTRENDEDNQGFFTLETHSDVLSYTRVLVQWKEPKIVAQRTWRSKWHLAFMPADYRQSLPGSPRANQKININEMAIPATGKSTLSNEVCVMSDAAQRVLRHEIRRAVATGEKINIKMQDLSVKLCDCAQHCGRSGDKKMLHWDITEIISFWIWANTQLKKNGGALIIELDKPSFASALPSMQGLRYPSYLA